MAASFMGRAEPVAVLGDFNFREGEPDYQVLTEILGMADVAMALGNRQNTILNTNVYRRASGRDRRKDYVFVRSGGDQNLVPRAIALSFDDRFEIPNLNLRIRQFLQQLEARQRTWRQSATFNGLWLAKEIALKQFQINID